MQQLFCLTFHFGGQAGVSVTHALSRRKHCQKMTGEGLANPAARLFSNPAGDYGSMVNERVGASDWEDGAELGDTWASRNSFSYGRFVTEVVCPRLCVQRAARL